MTTFTSTVRVPNSKSSTPITLWNSLIRKVYHQIRILFSGLLLRPVHTGLPLKEDKYLPMNWRFGEVQWLKLQTDG